MRNFNDYFMRKLVFAGLLLAFLVSGGWLARGEVVMVGWNGSADAGVIGYRIAYGKVSGKYDVQVEVGNQLEGLLVGLEEGERYYVVVVAYGMERVEGLEGLDGGEGGEGDASGALEFLESAPSEELEIVVPRRPVGGDELGIRKLTRGADGRVTLRLAVGVEWFTGGAAGATGATGAVWVEKSGNLRDWSVVGVVESGGVVVEMVDAGGGEGRRFYRLRVGGGGAG